MVFLHIPAMSSFPMSAKQPNPLFLFFPKLDLARERPYKAFHYHYKACFCNAKSVYAILSNQYHHNRHRARGKIPLPKIRPVCRLDNTNVQCSILPDNRVPSKQNHPKYNCYFAPFSNLQKHLSDRIPFEQ